MTTELKPCPFCGGAARFYHDHPVYENRMFIGCTECNAEVEPLDSVKHSKSDQVSLWNTRAVPDVPELVRYNKGTFGHLAPFDKGGYVRYDQTAAIISALKAELYVTQTERHADAEYIAHLEAKLAEYEKQKPVAWYLELSDAEGHCTYSNKPADGWKPLYASPAPIENKK